MISCQRLVQVPGRTGQDLQNNGNFEDEALWVYAGLRLNSLLQDIKPEVIMKIKDHPNFIGVKAHCGMK